MAKRPAGTQLNRDSNDDDNEPEERGTFSKASTDVLKAREMKSAKRSGSGDTSVGGSGTGMFKGFTGFSLTPQNSITSSMSRPPLTSYLTRTPDKSDTHPSLGLTSSTTSGSSSSFFSGLAKTAEAEKSDLPSLAGVKGLVVFKPTGMQAASLLSQSNSTASDSQQKPDQLPQPEISMTLQTPPHEPNSSTSNSANSADSDEVYHRYLKALNEGVSAWIKQHVDKNPLIDLSPIFDDYRAHMSDIEAKYKSKSDVKVSIPQNPLITNSVKNAVPTMTFGATSVTSLSENATTDSLKPVLPTGMFSLKPKIQMENTTPSLPSTQSALFPVKPFSLSMTTVQSNSKSPAKETVQGNGSDDDDEIQVVEEARRPLTADDHLDTIHKVRSKLFYKKKEEWTELGVGDLKLVDLDGPGTQILMRADTNLGNILINILLSKDTPASRSGKNYVMLVAKPNPPLIPDNTEPVTYLVKVKTAEDADQLLAKIDERKKLT